MRDWHIPEQRRHRNQQWKQREHEIVRQPGGKYAKSFFIDVVVDRYQRPFNRGPRCFRTYRQHLVASEPPRRAGTSQFCSLLAAVLRMSEVEDPEVRSRITS